MNNLRIVKVIGESMVLLALDALRPPRLLVSSRLTRSVSVSNAGLERALEVCVCVCVCVHITNEVMQAGDTRTFGRATPRFEQDALKRAKKDVLLYQEVYALCLMYYETVARLHSLVSSNL